MGGRRRARSTSAGGTGRGSGVFEERGLELGEQRWELAELRAGGDPGGGPARVGLVEGRGHCGGGLGDERGEGDVDGGDGLERVVQDAARVVERRLGQLPRL